METPKLENLNSSNCTERSIFLHYFEFWSYINKTYPKELKWTEKLYWYYHNLNETPKCPVCGRPVPFNTLKLGYREFCSNKCVSKSKDIKERRKQTNIERFGVENPMQNEDVKDKLKQTNLERFGVENPFASDKIKEKIKQTNQERLGVDYPMQNKKVYEKSKKTNIEKYGKEYNSQSEEIKNKKKQTCLERYGVEVNFQSEENKEKIRQTCLERYGVDNYSKTQEYKSTMKEQQLEIRQKMAETCLERYGVDNYSKTKKFKHLMNKKRPSILEKSYQTKKVNNTFNTSQIEEDFAKWLDDSGIEYIRQYRSNKYPFNCDFYFPKSDAYLEIQGSWVHGGHPYNESDNDDLKKLNEWKDKNTDFYDNAIETWTNRVPLKRQIAKENNLNWHEIFSTNLIDLINYAQTNICIS